MKRLLSIAILLGAFTSCNNANTTADNQKPGETTSSSSNSDALYFNFTVDGKEMHVAADDISSTYDETNKDTTFKIFAGKDGAPTLMLVIPHGMTRPSTTPNGSPDFAQNITQGSVSLQNYPEKNYTTNSFNTIYPEMSVTTPDAIVIMSSERLGDEGRIITGTINVKTYGEKSHTDPKSSDHVITGKFKIKHAFRGIKF